MKQINELNETMALVEFIRAEIQCAITNLPDNPNIKRVNQQCFTMSSADMMKDNPTMRLDPFFHDFKAQYKYIAEAIERARPENIVPLLEKIAIDGNHKSTTGLKTFHPQVILHLKRLINLPSE